MSEKPDRNLGLELLRVTEAAALAAARWVGRGQKEEGDGAAVNAMRHMMSTVQMSGTIIIGEGEKDNAPMLYNGESVGSGDGPDMDVAVDPVEGTNLLAKGLPNSIAVVAAAPKGQMWNPGPGFYMDKLVVGPEAAGKVDLDAPVHMNLKTIAKAKGVRVEEVTVVVLDRERNQRLIEEIRSAGARIRLISDGDVAPALMSALPRTGVDALMGIGGIPEGVITACAMVGMGGEMQGRLAPQSETERQRLLDAGYDLSLKLNHNDLVKSQDVYFAATGITPGSFLGGVEYVKAGAFTHSLVIRAHSGTWRKIESFHNWTKLSKISGHEYRA